MSYDFLEDAIDILREDGYGYIVIAAKTPMCEFRFENIGAEDAEIMLDQMSMIMDHLIEYFELQDLYEDEDYDEDDFFK